MKKHLLYFIPVIGMCFLAFSCANSPSTTLVGKYEGTYIRDSMPAIPGRVNVVEVNSLTVHFNVELDSFQTTSYNNVQILGGDPPYTLYYSGPEGILNGTADKVDMGWTIITAADTIIFTGVKN